MLRRTVLIVVSCLSFAGCGETLELGALEGSYQVSDWLVLEASGSSVTGYFESRDDWFDAETDMTFTVDGTVEETRLTATVRWIFELAEPGECRGTGRTENRIECSTTKHGSADAEGHVAMFAGSWRGSCEVYLIRENQTLRPDAPSRCNDENLEDESHHSTCTFDMEVTGDEVRFERTDSPCQDEPDAVRWEYEDECEDFCFVPNDGLVLQFRSDGLIYDGDYEVPRL